MLHWTPPRPSLARPPAAEVTPIAFFAGDATMAYGGSARADHARMLGHAAKRRRSAQGENGAYWRACAPAAVARAAAIRSSAAFSRLP